MNYCIFLIQTFAIEDCYKANLSASYSFRTSDQKYKIFEIPQWDNYEIEGNLKSTVDNRFSLALKLNNDNTSNAMARMGAYTQLQAFVSATDGSTIAIENKGSYTANTNIKVRFVYNKGNIKIYGDDVLYIDTSIPYYPTNLMLHSYTSSKTVSVSDLKIKPL